MNCPISISYSRNPLTGHEQFCRVWYLSVFLKSDQENCWRWSLLLIVPWDLVSLCAYKEKARILEVKSEHQIRFGLIEFSNWLHVTTWNNEHSGKRPDRQDSFITVSLDTFGIFRGKERKHSVVLRKNRSEFESRLTCLWKMTWKETVRNYLCSHIRQRFWCLHFLALFHHASTSL